MEPLEPLVITNFGGRLSRRVTGQLDSGLAKFETSFGYDPFSKPGNLTWLEQPTSITSGLLIDTIVGAKTRVENVSSAPSNMIYGVGDTGRLYKIQTSSTIGGTSIVAVGSVISGGETNQFGASLEFYGTPERLFVGSDNAVHSIPMSSILAGTFGGGETIVGSAANYFGNVTRPLKEFAGKLLFGNGRTIGVIDSTLAVTSSIIGLSYLSSAPRNVYSELNPPLPAEVTVQDIDVSPQNDYAYITASQIFSEQINDPVNTKDRQAAVSSDGFLFKWNGTDATITAATTIPSYAVTALQTYLNQNVFFSNDSFGGSVSNDAQKMLTLPQNKAPFREATLVNGNFVCWIVPEVVGTSSMVAAMYYFGALDNEVGSGLWRVMRQGSSLSNGFVYQTPINKLVRGRYLSINSGAAPSSIQTVGYGTHFYSTLEVNSTSSVRGLYGFNITPVGTGTPQLGVYETQTQLFSKKIKVEQIRVYCEPTVSGNGYQLDLIGSDGEVITNGSFTYSFAAGADPTSLTGSLDRINHNPAINDTLALGIRITNTGTVNMTFLKVEIDYSYSGK